MCRPIGNFLCLLWQHCSRPWSFICEPCSFDSGRTGFIWVTRVWNGSADLNARCVPSYDFSMQLSRWSFSRATHGKEMSFWLHCDWRWNMGFSPHPWSSTTMMRCKKKSWRGSKRRGQTSMTRGYKSRFQDLINVWTMLANMLKNKVMYRQFIHSVAFVN